VKGVLVVVPFRANGAQPGQQSRLGAGLRARGPRASGRGWGR
jgi:hypothetical protein